MVAERAPWSVCSTNCRDPKPASSGYNTLYYLLEEYHKGSKRFLSKLSKWKKHSHLLLRNDFVGSHKPPSFTLRIKNSQSAPHKQDTLVNTFYDCTVILKQIEFKLIVIFSILFYIIEISSWGYFVFLIES